MKRIYEMSEEEILDEALGAIPEYLSRLGRTGRFSTEECLDRCIGRVKELYRRSAGCGSSQCVRAPRKGLTGPQIQELTRICTRLDTPLRERIERAKDRHAKDRAVFQINSTTALAVIPAALKEAGLAPKVSAQKYRARVEISLPGDGRLRFYIRYRDLLKEGALDSVTGAVRDLKEILEDPGRDPASRRR
jgi:hypothetical protein